VDGVDNHQLGADGSSERGRMSSCLSSRYPQSTSKKLVDETKLVVRRRRLDADGSSERGRMSSCLSSRYPQSTSKKLVDETESSKTLKSVRSTQLLLSCCCCLLLLLLQRLLFGSRRMKKLQEDAGLPPGGEYPTRT